MSKRSWLRRTPAVRMITAAMVVFCSFIGFSLRIQIRREPADSELVSDERSKKRMNRMGGETKIDRWCRVAMHAQDLHTLDELTKANAIRPIYTDRKCTR